MNNQIIQAELNNLLVKEILHPNNNLITNPFHSNHNSQCNHNLLKIFLDKKISKKKTILESEILISIKKQ